MFGLNFMKFDSMNYVIHYQNGIVKKEGRGLSFFYYAPYSSIVAIPVQSNDVQFVFKETTKDYQEVSVQGQITFKISNPKQLAETLDFTVDTKGRYIKNDYEKIEQRLINNMQTACAAIIQQFNLKEALRNIVTLEHDVAMVLQEAKEVTMLGVEILGVTILGIKPTPEMARALEAKTRESLQKEADEAIYERRNFAVEQERIIKESELNTEIAVEEKQKQIVEKKMQTDVVKQQNTQQLKEMELTAGIKLEEQRTELVKLQTANEREEADMQAYKIQTSLNPFKELDYKVLMAITQNGNSAGNNMALAFREMAENASKIGNLTVTPELLSSIIKGQ